MNALHFDLHEVTLLLTCIECLIISISFLLFNSKQNLQRLFLSAYFANYAVMLCGIVLIWNESIQKTALLHQITLPLILSTTLLLQGPLLYFYIKSFRMKVFDWRPSYFVHLLPILISTGVIVGFNITTFKWLPFNWGVIDYNQSVRFLWAFVRCFPFFYVIACIIEEIQLQKLLKQENSTIPHQEGLVMSTILVGTLLSWGWSLMGYFAGGFLSEEVNSTIGQVNDYLNILLINVICIFGYINTRRIVNDWDHAQHNNKETDNVVKLFNQKIELINEAIQIHKVHLQPQITLDEFSESINISSAEVSSLLNKHFETNFFEFINQHRVEEAKRLLSSPENEQIPIQTLIFQAGFNSTSAFHRFFKRFVGKTPSQYRTEQLLKKP